MDKIVERFRKECLQYKDEIEAIYFFGSRAQGRERPDSDYDFLIVVKEVNKNFRERVYNIVIDILLETGKLISLKILTKNDFLKFSQIGLPFIENVLKEGIKIG